MNWNHIWICIGSFEMTFKLPSPTARLTETYEKHELNIVMDCKGSIFCFRHRQRVTDPCARNCEVWSAYRRIIGRRVGKWVGNDTSSPCGLFRKRKRCSTTFKLCRSSGTQNDIASLLSFLIPIQETSDLKTLTPFQIFSWGFAYVCWSELLSLECLHIIFRYR